MTFALLPPIAAIAPDLDRVVFADDASILGRVIGSDVLLATCIMLFVTTVLAVTAFGLGRRKTAFAANLARRRGERLNQYMRTVRLAEEIACLGIWQYDVRTGDQQWSNGLRAIFGVHHSDPFMEGDAETLLFANDVDLVGAVRARMDEQRPYDLEFELYGFDACARTVSLTVANLRGRDDRVHQIVAVARDVTREVSRKRELEFSRQAAVREADKARELAETDALTGLANRRKVMDGLDRLIVQVRGDTRPLALIVFDIDHFKQVNDTHGHAAGDAVLKKVAAIASDQARQGDIVGRIGGEEFVWIVPGATNATGRLMSERLRLRIAQESATDIVSAVTISAGIAELLPDDSSLSLLARADKALYAAKGDGRNRVRLAA